MQQSSRNKFHVPCASTPSACSCHVLVPSRTSRTWSHLYYIHLRMGHYSTWPTLWFDEAEKNSEVNHSDKMLPCLGLKRQGEGRLTRAQKEPDLWKTTCLTETVSVEACSAVRTTVWQAERGRNTHEEEERNLPHSPTCQSSASVSHRLT